MSIKIIGTESLGIRGMCCLVEVGRRRVLIDPGIALGYQRHGLLPHPLQVETGIRVKNNIIKAMKTATDIILSHFHGDHVPLFQANPYQLSFRDVPSLAPGLHVWTKSEQGLSSLMQRRASELSRLFGEKMQTAEGCSEGPLTFSRPVPHGLQDSKFGTVMMTRIDMGGKVFVHASDTQLLDTAVIDKILMWDPDIVFTSGPPLYLQALTGPMRKHAWENGVRLAQNTETLIVDHHLLRSRLGIVWLDNMSQAVGKTVYCAADFMNRPRLLLEAERAGLYDSMPVPENWHRDYEAGRVTIP